MILPFVRELFADLEKAPSYQRVAPLLKGRAGRIRVSGLTTSAKCLHYPLFARTAGAPLLIIVPTNRAAEDLVPLLQAGCDLTGAAHPSSVIYLPAYDVLPFENLSPHPEIQEARAAALWKVATNAAQIVVAPLEAASMRLRDREFYAGLARIVRRTESVDIDELTAHLNTTGYAQVDVVEMPGQYARRGGIFDVYPPEADRPLRFEFFGDDVETIRKFDPDTQRSSAPVDEVILLPLSETPVDEEILAPIHARLSGHRIRASESSLREVAAATGATVFPGWEMYAPLAGARSNIFDLMPNALVLVDEPSAISGQAERWWSKLEEAHARSGVGNLVRPEELYLVPADWRDMVDSVAGLEISELGVEGGGAMHVNFVSQPTRAFHGDVPGLTEDVRSFTAEGKHVLIAAPNLGEVERMAGILSEYGMTYRLGSRQPAPGGETYLDESGYYGQGAITTTIVKAALPRGVAFPEAGLILFGAQDLFEESEQVAKRSTKQKSKTGIFLSDFRDLAVGDYVVHVEHGIAMYQGLREIAQGDAVGEFMVLEFAEAAKLYVPLTRLDLIQKYRSSEGGARPLLSRLGGQQWAKTKARVKKAMRDMAGDLLKLYAERKSAQGHAFPTDTQWMREFEDAFEHTETGDQQTAIHDIKRDMESTMPMDRLLCGDVGYGKTEVAMRAAFKAVNDNKQVAVLAPTTVLAFQHFETFKNRFKSFPVNIEMVSRFRTPKQVKEILERVEQGKVDVIIGTHRLLSRDIRFSDLGLVVVDEEQRFGVAHKERLKQLKTEVDVLTMSATPIPRTLHMSLVGLRDMSVIETPPKDRMAIQTVVATFDDKLLKSAIGHELERGGQVFFVHNRVETIYEISEKVRELAPNARILVGHGQMGEGELEKVMLAFMRHEADILIATTIIENGVDIPLANTIIINRADRHGLSELYQMRGRVGRSDRRAYCYLLVPAENELTEMARRRLAALKEFSDLGAGFKIAALDLELRGAGNLLGGEQSGQIDAIGFEMYTTLLERTVRELKGEVEAERAPTQLNLALNLRIPPEYIAEENQRLRMYKRIAGVETEEQLTDVASELRDRYGEPPAPVRNLVSATSLKLLAERIGVNSLERKLNLAHIKFDEAAAVDPAKLAEFAARTKGAQFTPAGALKVPLTSTHAEEVINRLRNVLDAVADPHALAARELQPQPVV